MAAKQSFDLDMIGGAALFRELVDEVLGAGEEARAMQLRGVSHTHKSDASPVTEADHAVETRLKAFLAKRFPMAGFLGEETGGDVTPQKGLRFVLDPIDGTRAFMRNLPSWSILLGLESDGAPVLGVVFMPATEEIFTAVQGQGAFMNGQPLHVSDIDKLDRSTISHGALQQFTLAGMTECLSALGEQTFTQRGFADFEGYKNVLLGRVDAMIDPAVKPWDLCGPAALIREAGGRLTDMEGKETIYGGGAVASNGKLHDAVLDLLMI